jgi:hypothetical protein
MTDFLLRRKYKHKRTKIVVFEPIVISYTRDGIAMHGLWFRVNYKHELVPLAHDDIIVTNDELENWSLYAL